MNIVIDNGMDNLKKELESRGYNVFKIGDNVVADAVLYKEKDSHAYYEVNNVASATSGIGAKNSTYGAILVNVNNKSTDEIVNILNKRVYSPLI